jgi:hypothetical protein
MCHNHPLDPPPRELPEAVANSVHDLLSVGVSNIQVINYIEKQTGQLLSRVELAAFHEPGLLQALLGETDSLLASLGEDDDVFVYAVDFRGEPRRAAILVITPQERTNLQHFGDVIWLDGTVIKNDLGWTTWPITLCDESSPTIVRIWPRVGCFSLPLKMQSRSSGYCRLSSQSSTTI